MKNILLIQTGGTISMSSKPAGAELDPETWNRLLHAQFPELKTLANIDSIPLFFINSSDINAGHWQELARCIEQNYSNYDGFVILHGTDTMAYTASALSFALVNLAKPVVLTGSQIPMSSLLSDGRHNLINAIETAKTGIPEVVICFNHHIYRGNRATKQSIEDFDAFVSPNFRPLARISSKVTFAYEFPLPPGEFKNTAGFSDKLAVLTVYPSMNTAFYSIPDPEKIRAVIINGFGSGNLPADGPYSLLPFIQQCNDMGIITAVGSQATRNTVDLNKYPPGRKALQAGAVSCGDMTFEACVTKMMYLLEKHTARQETERLFTEPLAGELTA